ncbi:MAG: hypothetical protein VX278_09420 [Myxococcota bacterium]|nr:hypothetical protein [Myxococcota bacterium]
MKFIKKRLQQLRRSSYLRARGFVMNVSPDSVVENRSDEELYIIINANREHYDLNLHSITVLPPGCNTVDEGIPSPEGIVLRKHLYLDQSGEIRTPSYTPVIKTPIASRVVVSNMDAQQRLAAEFSSTPIGLRGRVIVLFGIKPSLKAAIIFSKGRFIRPKDSSPNQIEYDRMAAFFPPWSELSE